MITRWMRRLIGLTGLMGVAALAQSTIDPDTGGIVRDAAASKARVASFVEEVSSGKMAEEGQGHIGHAMAYYSNVIRDFDSIRKPAAQALFQYAGLMIGSNTPKVGVDAYRRILREFPDFEDLANASRARLRDHGVDDVGGGAAGEGVAVGMEGDDSPEALRQRYGLSPELAKRYGIGVGGSGGGGGMAAGVGNAYGSGRGSMAAAGSARPSVDDVGRSRNPAAEMMEEMATSMRAELIQLATQLRKVRREQRAAAVDNLDKLPVSLIEDATLSRILTDLQRAREEVAINSRQLDPSQIERPKLHEELAIKYLRETYRPRLEATESQLMYEMDRLRMEMEKSEFEAKELRSVEKSR